ncbi:hypothetical protein LXL04_005006 [Taraxacum kok-saghyz]
MYATLYQSTAFSFDSFANLTPLARVLQKVIVENVNPRKSDMGRVQFQDMYVVYALITRSLYLSFAYNAMCNIWHAYDTRGRNTVPHMVLISRYIIHELGTRTRGIPRTTPYPKHVIHASRISFRGVTFERRGGVHMITDSRTHARYVSPFGEQEKEEPQQEAADGHGDGAALAPGWNMHNAWDSFIDQNE